jgi:hypothetical protein
MVAYPLLRVEKKEGWGREKRAERLQCGRVSDSDQFYDKEPSAR